MLFLCLVSKQLVFFDRRSEIVDAREADVLDNELLDSHIGGLLEQSLNYSQLHVAEQEPLVSLRVVLLEEILHLLHKLILLVFV